MLSFIYKKSAKEHTMKIERSKNAGRNIVFGVLHNLYNIFVPFLLRTLLIKLLGERYLGLNSLFTSILQVLNLAELGVGSAMVYSMYRPIAEDDEATICALMAMYRKFYFLIGLVIAVAGLCLTPFLPRLVKMDTVPSDVNVYILYLIHLGATVLSYWLFAYKNCLLTAHQRNDVQSKVQMISSTATYLLQILILVFIRNFYLYSMVSLVVGIASNLATAIIVQRMYPHYHPAGKLPRDITASIGRNIRDLFTSKLGAVIYDSADTIVVSAYLGLTVLAIYQNYYYILTSVAAFLMVVFRSVTAGIGNSLTTESREKNYNDFGKLTFIICWISGFCAVCMLCLYQPFMELWMGKQLMFEFEVVVCFCIYFYLRQVNNILTTYKDAAGMWHEDRFRPLVAALSNLAMNLIFVRYIGIYGVILSTVLAVVLIGQPWLLHNLFTVLFDRRCFAPYVCKLFGYAALATAEGAVSYGVCLLLPRAGLLLTLAERLAVCLVVPNAVHLLVYRRTAVFAETVELFDNLTRGRLRFLTSRLTR